MLIELQRPFIENDEHKFTRSVMRAAKIAVRVHQGLFIYYKEQQRIFINHSTN